jgi:DNA-binding HxlR family transcriptional regulator
MIRQSSNRTEPKGLDLLPVMLELARWGATYDPKTAAPKELVCQIETERQKVIRRIRAPHEKRHDDAT